MADQRPLLPDVVTFLALGCSRSRLAAEHLFLRTTVDPSSSANLGVANDRHPTHDLLNRGAINPDVPGLYEFVDRDISETRSGQALTADWKYGKEH